MALLVKILLLIICFLLCNSLLIDSVQAESLSERLTAYPNWQNLPELTHSQGEIDYPDWFEGTWQVNSLLIEQIAPLAPEFVTPGFEGNRRYLQKPVNFTVKFKKKTFISNYNWSLPSLVQSSSSVIADRLFNAQQITQAYLGKSNILEIQLLSKPSPQLISDFPEQRRLVSTVIGYSQQLLESNHFLTTELTNQKFEGETRRYFNRVETTTNYHLINPTEIEAEQITAIYLSPQDSDYLTVKNQPLALYRYQLSLHQLSLNELF